MLVGWLVSVALFCYAATGVTGFTVTSKQQNVRVKENEEADLSCEYTADFGTNARVEWKFKDPSGNQKLVVLNGELVDSYRDRATLFRSNLRLKKVTPNDNGVYDCGVTGNDQYAEVKVTLTVLVPPGVPVCRIPSSVTTGNKAILSCHDSVGSPPPTYKWYRDDVLLSANPSTNAAFKNTNYTLNRVTGKLEFPRTGKLDTGSYYCEAENGDGTPQRCKGGRMEIHDINTGGIVAGVIVFLLLLGLLAFGIWYAHKKGYLPKKSDSAPKPNVVYQPPSLYGGGEEEDGDFKQKSSFVV